MSGAWSEVLRASRLFLLTLGLVVGFALGLASAHFSPLPGASGEPGTQAESTEGGDDFALPREIRGLIESEYLRASSVERETLMQGAARGMVQELGDPNSLYETPGERAANQSQWTGRYEGVGLQLDQRDGQTIVTAPIEGGPAERAGILAGDVLLEVDGRPLTARSLSAQAVQIRGPRGTTVTLTVRREGLPTPLQIAIVRDEVRLISARSRLLEDGVGLLRISQFTEATVEETRTALESVLAQQPRGLVLDLRGNAGGLLRPAVEVSGFFLGGGPVVLEAHADGETKSYDAPAGEPLTGLPILVLVDRGSASAAEIVSAALREAGRAELLGERTYGKSTVQYIHGLSDGSGLRLTVAQWRTPNGLPIPAEGIVPDLVVARPTAPRGEPDELLELARLRLAGQGTGSVPTPTGPVAG